MPRRRFSFQICLRQPNHKRMFNSFKMEPRMNQLDLRPWGLSNQQSPKVLSKMLLRRSSTGAHTSTVSITPRAFAKNVTISLVVRSLPQLVRTQTGPVKLKTCAWHATTDGSTSELSLTSKFKIRKIRQIKRMLFESNLWTLLKFYLIINCKFRAQVSPLNEILP